jgi:hypothetical protein
VREKESASIALSASRIKVLSNVPYSTMAPAYQSMFMHDEMLVERWEKCYEGYYEDHTRYRPHEDE